MAIPTDTRRHDSYAVHAHRPVVGSHAAARRPGQAAQGRPAARVQRVDQVVGDKAFDGAAQRRACAAIGAEAVIPAKANRVDPEPLDAAAYRERNRVERLLGKAKEFRRIATRYEKLKATFLGMLHLVFGFIRLRG